MEPIHEYVGFYYRYRNPDYIGCCLSVTCITLLCCCNVLLSEIFSYNYLGDCLTPGELEHLRLIEEALKKAGKTRQVFQAKVTTVIIVIIIKR